VGEAARQASGKIRRQGPPGPGQKKIRKTGNSKNIVCNLTIHLVG